MHERSVGNQNCAILGKFCAALPVEFVQYFDSFDIMNDKIAMFLQWWRRFPKKCMKNRSIYK